MPNYLYGKIYKIQPNGDHDEGDVYIGSTAQVRLCDRWGTHKSAYKGNYNKCCSSILFDKYSIENCSITLIENFPCASRDQLNARRAGIKKILCALISELLAEL